jgi:hypothetical protein
MASREPRLVENESRVRPVVVPVVARGQTGLAVMGGF